jgi:hypothetical protein
MGRLWSLRSFSIRLFDFMNSPVIVWYNDCIKESLQIDEETTIYKQRGPCNVLGKIASQKYNWTRYIFWS